MRKLSSCEFEQRSGVGSPYRIVGLLSKIWIRPRPQISYVPGVCAQSQAARMVIVIKNGGSHAIYKI